MIDYEENSLGILEVLGYSVALASMDQAAKNTNIKIISMETNNPTEGDLAKIPNVFIVKFIGKISDVKLALEIAKNKALEFIEEKNIHVHQINGDIRGLKLLIEKGKVQPSTGDKK